MAFIGNRYYIKSGVFTLLKPKQTVWGRVQHSLNSVYGHLNSMSVYMFILLVSIFSYEIIPFNEEFIAVMSIFFAFITIDAFASGAVKSVFQEEQQTMFLYILRKSYNAFSLSLLQREIESRVGINRRYKKLLAYSFVYNILFLHNYFDVVIHDEVVLEDNLDLDFEENPTSSEFSEENLHEDDE